MSTKLFTYLFVCKDCGSYTIRHLPLYCKDSLYLCYATDRKTLLKCDGMVTWSRDIKDEADRHRIEKIIKNRGPAYENLGTEGAGRSERAQTQSAKRSDDVHSCECTTIKRRPKPSDAPKGQDGKGS